MSQTNRRTFLTTVARWCAMLGLGAIVARFLGRSDADGDASAGVPCRRCAELARCNRPDGVRARADAGLDPSPATSAPDDRGLCGERVDGELVSRWIRRDEA